MVCTLKGVKYEHEVLIPNDRIGTFLKKPMHLEKLEKDLNTLFKERREALNSIWSKKHYFIKEKGVAEIRASNTASLRLYALCGPNEAAEVKQYGEFHCPEKTLPLPRFAFSKGKATLYFPLLTLLQESSLSNLYGWLTHEEESPRGLALQYQIGSLLGLDLIKCDETIDGKKYNQKVEIPYAYDQASNRILQLLERDLGMCELPPEYAIPYDDKVAGSGRVTCWNELLFGFFGPLGVRFAPHGSVNSEGLRLAPLRIDPPHSLRDYSGTEISEMAYQIFTEAAVSPQEKGRYSNAIDRLFNQVAKEEPSALEAAVKGAINHFFYELTNVLSQSSLETKKNSLINVANAAHLPLANCYIRLSEETKRVSGQEVNVKDLLLALAEEWKNDKLMAIFSDSPESTHGFATAQVKWGAEFGLNIQLGLRDPKRESCGNAQLTKERETLFRERCNNTKTLTEEISRKINDNYGSVMDISLYETYTRTWLEEMGHETNTLEETISSFFPTDANYRVQVSPDGVKFLLTQIGLLNP